MTTPAGKPLIVVGAGGFGREVIWLARDVGAAWNPLGYLDDGDHDPHAEYSGLPVLGKIESWPRYEDAWFVIAVGSPRARLAIVERMRTRGEPQFATLVHPSVQMSTYVSMAPGTIVAAGCIVTTQITLGRHSIVNINVTIGHDTVFGDYCTVAPGVPISGNVTLEDGVEIGTGATLRQGIRIGTGAMVGMGSVVTKSVDPGVLVTGVPARPVRELAPFGQSTGVPSQARSV